MEVDCHREDMDEEWKEDGCDDCASLPLFG